MVSRLGMVPAIVCVVVAALLGGWGWGARDDSKEQAREEARQSGDDGDDGLFSVEGEGPSGTELTCQILVRAAMLEAPVDLGGAFVPPGDPSVTTLAVSTVDTAYSLVAILGDELFVDAPELDQPDLRAAVTGLRTAIQVAFSRTAEPLADPEVIAAAAALRDALGGRCR